MSNLATYKFLNFFIAGVWIINGLFCKLLNLIPRHQEIVSQIVSLDHSRLLIVLIGIAEIVMAVWIVSNYKSKINTLLQILIIATMNVLEFTLVPDLLLWGKLNSIFALAFIALLYYKEFILLDKTKGQ